MPRVEQVQQKALEEFRAKNRAAAKRKKEANTRQWGEALITFICLFFLLSLLFLQIAKKMTPKIDTSIGSNAVEETEQVETKGLIDDRLKIIQYDDVQAAEELRRQKEQEIFNEELDEKVVLPRTKVSNETQQNEDNVEQSLDEKVQSIISKNLGTVRTLDSNNTDIVTNKNLAPTVPTENKTNLEQKITKIKNTDIAIEQAPNYKVLVGSYQTAEQAQLAKSILRETSLGQNAFVKLVDNIYTIQIGSYISAEQAKKVAQELTTKSFPARVYYEKPQQTNSGNEKNIF